MMPSVYFISDLHLGHEKIPQFRSGFGLTSEDHDKDLIIRINSVVKSKDKLYVLGDSAFNLAGADKLDLINCKNKELIIGNHDSPSVYKYFDKIHGFKKYKEFWLSHCPIHPNELRGKINIHGHVHSKTIPDNRYFSVCVEANQGYPVNIQQIRDSINDKSQA